MNPPQNLTVPGGVVKRIHPKILFLLAVFRALLQFWPHYPMENSGIAGFRRRAWIKCLAGLFGFAAIFGIFIAISKAGYQFNNPFKLIAPCIPFVYFCIGFIELVTGRPYRQLAQAWMALKGWQRGVIGTFIVLAALAMMLVCMGIVFTYFVH
jgi:hypothetical protein